MDETGTAEGPGSRGRRGEKVAEQVNKRQKRQNGKKTRDLAAWRLAGRSDQICWEAVVFIIVIREYKGRGNRGTARNINSKIAGN